MKNMIIHYLTLIVSIPIFKTIMLINLLDYIIILIFTIDSL